MSEPYGRQEGAQREAENRRPLGPDIDAEGRRMDEMAQKIFKED